MKSGISVLYEQPLQIVQTKTLSFTFSTSSMDCPATRGALQAVHIASGLIAFYP
jgi:hypothetical protein